MAHLTPDERRALRRLIDARSRERFERLRAGERPGHTAGGLPGDWRDHGTVNSYREWGCRCELCTLASRDAQRRHRASNRAWTARQQAA